MLLSVVTIAKNDLPGLIATRESVERQDVPPLQHIIVDGASTDGTISWLEALESRRSAAPEVTIRSAEDSGIYNAMNRGLQLVSPKASHILLLNAGDELADPSTLAHIDAHLKKAGSQWCFGKSMLSADGGRTGAIHALHIWPWLRFITGLGTVPHQATVVSAQLAKEVGGFREDVGHSADQEWILRLWAKSSPSRISDVIAICDDSGISSRQAPGTWAKAMSNYRADHGMQFKPRPVDVVVTWLAVGFDLAKQAVTRLTSRQ